MKKSIFALIACCAANAVLAAGEYDGVYQYGLSPAYYSVHQNGNTLLVASMGFISVEDGITFRVGGFEVSPPSLGFWDYATGTINGNTARLVGVGMFGACVSTTDVTFDAFGGATVTNVSYTNTALGTSQGVNCAAILQTVINTVGPTISVRRIF